MLSFSVLLALVLAFCGLSAVQAQTFACGGAGYNLSSIGDLNGTFNGYNWTVNPCLPITSGACAGSNATFCQGSTVVSYYNPAVNVVSWMSITNGIMSRTVNGQDACSAQTVRTGTVEYFCDATATTAYLYDVEEVEICQYIAQVYTSIVCGLPLNVTQEPVGLPFDSYVCGGGLFNLTTLDSEDHVFDYTTDGPGILQWRPCSTLAINNCSAGASMCQISGSGGGGGFELSAGSVLAHTYTLQPNGMIIQSQDGTLCGQQTNTSYGYPRETNVILVCNETATTPYLTDFVEGTTTGYETTASFEYCHYTVTFQTNAVCNRLTTGPPSILQPAFACGGAGYDLTLISAVDMVLPAVTSGFTWILNPCRPTTQGPCAGQGATLCQAGTLESGGGGVAVAAYYQPIFAPIEWSTLNYNGSNAIQSFSIYGDQGCGSYDTRTARVIYVCDPGQTAPFSKLLSVTEGPTCQYTAIVNTSVVCGSAAAVTSTTAIGLSYTSTVCGGGLYDLSSLDTSDFSFISGDGQYYWRPCSVVTSNANCTAANATFCQLGSPVNALATSLALNPAAVNSYTPQTNGLFMQSQDGTLCGSIPRAASTYLVCNQSATTPQFVSYSENSGIAGFLNDGEPYCHYELIISTIVVCSTSAAAPSRSSSSGGVVVVSGSSSSAASAVSSSSVAASNTATTTSSSAATSAAAAVLSSSSAAAPVSAASSSSSAASVAAPSTATVATSSTAATVVPSSSTAAPVVVPSSSTATTVVPSSTATVFVSTAAATSAPATSSVVVVLGSSSAVVVVTPSSTAQATPTIVNGATSVYLANGALVVVLTVAVLLL